LLQRMAMRRPFCDERAEHRRGALRRRAEHRRWSPSTASGAPARPEGAPDSGKGWRGSGKAGDGRRGSSASPPLLEGTASSASGAAAAGRWGREPSSGVFPAPAREPSSDACPAPSLILNLGPTGRRNSLGRGFLQIFCLMGWTAWGPSNSGRREYVLLH
jgi:hypothetical protein